MTLKQSELDRVAGRAENLQNQSKALEKELSEAREKIAKYGEEI